MNTGKTEVHSINAIRLLERTSVHQCTLISTSETDKSAFNYFTTELLSSHPIIWSYGVNITFVKKSSTEMLPLIEMVNYLLIKKTIIRQTRAQSCIGGLEFSKLFISQVSILLNTYQEDGEKR